MNKERTDQKSSIGFKIAGIGFALVGILFLVNKDGGILGTPFLVLAAVFLMMGFSNAAATKNK